MLNRLLFKYQRLGQMIIAFLGTLLGLSFLLISIQFYYDLKSVLNQEEEIFGANTFILQKKVSGLNTLSLGNNAFRQKDIQKLIEQDFVVRLDTFKTSTYDVQLKLETPYFRTDGFVQALPQNYFSDVQANWQWTPESEFVPIVMPEDYLTLYNHGFAPSQGTPQIAKETLYELEFSLEIKENGKVLKKFPSKIVGLTNKINSILVPESFLKFTNARYKQEGKQKAPSRVIIQTTRDSYSAVESYIKENNLETSKSVLDKAKIKTYLSIIMIALLVVNFIILALSLLAFIQYSQIVIYKTDYEIQTLLRIGYSVKKITLTYIRFFAILFAIIAALAILAVFTFKRWSMGYMESMGFDFEPGVLPIVFYTSAVLFIIFTVFNLLNIRLLIKKLL